MKETKEELVKYPAYVAFGVDKILRLQELKSLMDHIHRCHSDIRYVYRASNSETQYVEKLKRHNYENDNMRFRNHREIDEYLKLSAQWAEFWKGWNQSTTEEG